MELGEAMFKIAGDTMHKTYLTADSHAGHDNILHLCHRPFPNIESMEAELIANHNEIVTDSDLVWNLGDVAYKCSPQHVVDYLSALKGQHAIILGNHDKPLRQAYRLGLLRDLWKSGKVEIIGGKELIEDPNLWPSYLTEIEGQSVFLSHCGTRTWPGAFRGTIHCYGHSHSKLPMLYKSMDVGVDMETETHKRFTPWSWSEIMAIMNTRNEPFSEED